MQLIFKKEEYEKYKDIARFDQDLDTHRFPKMVKELYILINSMNAKFDLITTSGEKFAVISPSSMSPREYMVSLQKALASHIGFLWMKRVGHIDLLKYPTRFAISSITPVSNPSFAMTRTMRWVAPFYSLGMFSYPVQEYPVFSFNFILNWGLLEVLPQFFDLSSAESQRLSETRQTYEAIINATLNNVKHVLGGI